MECIFLNAAGTTLFVRDDMESGHWVQEQLNVTAEFPFNANKVIQTGQRIAFRDPATDTLEVFEIINVTNQEPDHFQQITTEHICVAELSNEHINKTEITDKTAAQALTTALTGTLWSVGNNSASGTNSADLRRGSVWDAVNTIQQNWNVYITPRVTISAAGAITGRYLDIAPAQGTWRGLRLSVRKNLVDPAVTYDDSEVYTALYGYGGSVNVAQTGQDDKTEELTFKDEVWTATSAHPAKPSGQTYLEWPEKTAIYGRNGRPRYGYYQNANIKDAAVLLQKTWESLQKSCEPKISISGTCVDLYRLGYKDQPIRLHDMAIVEIEETGELLYRQVICNDVDLVDPTGTRLEIGDYIQNIVNINRDINTKASGGGGGGGGRGSMTNLEDEDIKTWTEFIKTNNQIGMVVGYRDGTNYIKAGQIVLAINESGKPGEYESTAWINADHINISATQDAYALAGDLEHDADGKLIIKSAGGMYVQRTEQGITSQFGVFDNGNLTGGIIVNKVNDSTSTYITGDHINISGTSTVHTLAGEMETDANGKLIIKSAGGMYVQRTESGITSQFGVFDNGNLTGGIIVNKVNDSTGTYITGDHINISGTSTVYSLAGEMEVDANGNLIIKDGAGFKARVGQAEFGIYNENNLTAGVIVGKINDSTGQTFAAVKADHINISGTSTAHMLSGSIVYDANGNLVLKQSSGGGVVVERTEGQTTSTFGVWDRGNLTGGVMVQQINGTTGTYITGDHINISATSTAQTLAGAMERDSSGHLVIKEGAGLYAEHTEGGSVAKFGVWDHGNLTGGVMVEQINGQTGTITKLTGSVIDIGGLITAINSQTGQTQVMINADQITLDGETTIESLLSGDSEFTNIWTNDLSASDAEITNLTADTLNVDGDDAEWKSVSVTTSISTGNTGSKTWLISGDTWTGSMLTWVLANNTTINYLGK